MGLSGTRWFVRARDRDLECVQVFLHRGIHKPASIAHFMENESVDCPRQTGPGEKQPFNRLKVLLEFAPVGQGISVSVPGAKDGLHIALPGHAKEHGYGLESLLGPDKREIIERARHPAPRRLFSIPEPIRRMHFHHPLLGVFLCLFVLNGVSGCVRGILQPMCVEESLDETFEQGASGEHLHGKRNVLGGRFAV
jgi:hypothetical protein